MSVEELRSRRKTRKVARLYAIICQDTDGKEGVVRYNTPVGSFPWITDDESLVPKILEAARAEMQERGLRYEVVAAVFERRLDRRA